MDAAPHLPSEPAPHPGRWTIGLLLAVGVLVNYFDRVNLSVSHSALVTSFGITPLLFGQLSAAYSWTYAACQLPTGALLDTFGVRRVSLVSICIWGLASLAAAVAPGVLLFFAARLLLGIGEAPTFPGNAKAVGLWFPPSERSLATAVFDSAAKFANAIGVPVLGILLLHIGWRLSFGVTALLSFSYLALFALLYRDPDRLSLRDALPAALPSREERQDPSVTPTNTNDQQPTTAPPPIPILSLLREPKVLGLAIGFGSYNYVFYLLLTWLPTYLVDALHLTEQRSFLFTGAPWLLATATDLLVGGWLVDVLIHRGYNADRVRRTVLIAGTCCGFGILGAAFAHSLPAALLPISLAIGGLSVAAPIGWSLPSLLVPNSSTGRVGGIVNFSNQISAIAAPILTGYTVARTGHYAWAFSIAAAYICLGVASYIFLLGRIEPIDLRRALAR